VGYGSKRKEEKREVVTNVCTLNGKTASGYVKRAMMVISV
jgi:hypothetical protein